jgi:LuxR family transcriptional regulator, maltose regulon positive regulatory protein
MQLAKAEQVARQQKLVYQLPEVVAAQVLILLRQGKVVAAAQLAQTHDLPVSQARVHLAQGNPSIALAVLAAFRQQVESKNWADERLKVLVLQALAYQAHGEKEKALHLLGEALALAEPEGFIRLFVDEGLPMMQLLSAAAARGVAPAYVGKLLAAFPNFAALSTPQSKARTEQSERIQNPKSEMVEPLSEREVEILHLIAQGLSNQAIGAQLFLALSTVKGHNQRIFDKLQVQRRTEAVARARTLGLL